MSDDIPAIPKPEQNNKSQSISSADFFVNTQNNSLDAALDMPVVDPYSEEKKRAVAGLDGDWDHGIYSSPLYGWDEEESWDSILLED